MIPKACMFPSLPWSVPIPVVVYLFTCSIDLKPSLSANSNKIILDCDCLGIAGGWTPAVHLFTQSGGKLKFREKDQVFIPNKYPSKQISIGSCNGDFELDQIIKNSSDTLKDFLEIDNTDYDNLTVKTTKETSKKNIWPNIFFTSFFCGFYS